MARQVHLVGSVGLRDAETVFTTVSVMLGSCCPRIPDGETGERGYWIRWQRNTFARNLGFEEFMTTRSPVTSSVVKFAVDSLLEGDGFELPVPVRQAKLTRFCR